MPEFELAVYPQNARDERIVALRVALGCVSPESGIGVNEAIKNAQTILNYIRDGKIPGSAEISTIGAKA